MDSEPYFIGSNTENGRRNPPNTFDGKGKKPFGPKGNKSSGPKGMVHVYVKGELMGQMPLGVLTRFSKRAATEFPRPAASADDAKNDASGESGAQDKADGHQKVADFNQVIAKVGKLTVESAKAPDFVPGGKPSDDSGKGVGRNTTASDSKEKPHLVLQLEMEEVWTHPSKEAFNFAFKWMHGAKLSTRGEKPLEFCLTDPDRVPLSRLIDFYAAAMCLELRPFPIKHKHDILKKLTDVPPYKTDIQFIHEHLPLNDPILTRALTSFSKSRGRSGPYSKEERQEVERYINHEDRALYKRWDEIVHHQRQFHQKGRMENQASELQSLAESFEGTTPATSTLAQAYVTKPTGGNSKGKKAVSQANAVAAPGKDAVNRAESTSSTASEKDNVGETEPSKSKDEHKQSNGKGVEGKHVPGA